MGLAIKPDGSHCRGGMKLLTLDKNGAAGVPMTAGHLEVGLHALLYGYRLCSLVEYTLGCLGCSCE